jgi:hypothetical protein
MLHRTKRFRILLGILFAVGCIATTYATSSLLSQFDTLYGTTGTSLDSCSTCHTSNIPALNPYGTDLQNNGNNFQAIENLDSDGDGFTNIQEIRAGTLPGDPTSHPASSGGGDTMPPTVTAFTIPSTANSLTIPITAFTATDNVGVAGYLVTESATTPAATDPGWMTTPPASYTFSSQGAKILYAWAKDAAGNVSTSLSATTTITISSGGSDTTPPTITSFTLPPTSTTRTVKILTLSATDNVGVTGYLVTQSSMAPPAGSRRWRAQAPTSYTFGEEARGTKTLWAWAKDAAGNVSAGASATTKIGRTGGDDGGGDDDGSGGSTGDDDGGMDVWSGRWFSVSIQPAGSQAASSSGFLKIQSWDQELSQMQATLFTRSSSTGKWQSTNLVLDITSGNIKSFLTSFDYSGLLQFTASVTATVVAGQPRSATLTATGLAPALQTTPSGTKTNATKLITMIGHLISDSAVPAQILH